MMSSRARRRLRSACSALAVVAAIAVFLGFRLLDQATASTTLNVIAVEPRPADTTPVAADVAAELADVTRRGQDLLVTGIGDGVAEPAYSGTFFCNSDTDAITCDESRSRARNDARIAASSLIARAAPENMDLLAIFREVASYTTAHKTSSVRMFVNTTGRQTAAPVNLMSPDLSGKISNVVRAITLARAWPDRCAGWQVHMIVPASGIAAHDDAMRTVFARLLRQCGGRLVSWTPRWITNSAHALGVSDQRVSIHQAATSTTYSVPGAFFDIGSSTLRPNALPALDQIAESIASRFAGAHITCIGSADATGSAELNQQLSRARAASVAKYLTTGNRIDPALVTSDGIGARPDDGTDVSRQNNRRVDITVAATIK